MEFWLYQAECGDCGRLRYVGNDGLFHNIFIDSGYERTFKSLLFQEIKRIINQDEKIDLWILTHIHDDHIGGVTKYWKAILGGEIEDIVNKWFYNPPRNYNKSIIVKNDDTSTASSIKQGDGLYYYLNSKRKMLDYDISKELGTVDVFGGKLTFLSPTKENLLKLREKYKPDKGLPLEKTENDSISIPSTQKQSDYHIPLEDFDIQYFNEDNSLENASSISFLFELAGKKILWLSDAIPSDIVKALNDLGYSSTNRLRCDWVKVAHHGSTGNNSNKLYDIIDCCNYLVSANGENIHRLPSKECMARILRNKFRNIDIQYKLFFTYDNPTLRRIFEIDGDSTYKKWNFQPIYLNDKSFKF